jgi:uncharacterized membrane protein YjjP (DUF1212 family)
MDDNASDKLKVKFLILTAKALHRYGASTDRIEAALYLISEKLNIKADYFSLPTSFTASFKLYGEDGEPDEEYTRMLRLDPGKINLEKLYLADKIVDDVIDEVVSIRGGISALKAIIEKEPLHPDWLFNISLWVLASGVAIILGGNYYDALISGVIGLLIGLFTSEVKIERIDTVYEAFIAFIISFCTFMSASYIEGLNPHIIILSSLIYYVPGLSLTMAIGEVASQNLTAGTARFMGALVILMKLGFGAFLGTFVAKKYFFALPGMEMQSPLWLIIMATFMICLSFVVTFQARWKDAFIMLFAGASTFWLNRYFRLSLDQIGAVLLAGMYIGSASNLYARVFKNPSMIFSLPAIILLVPGSIGFKGLEFLFSHNTIEGINTLFNTFIIGIALVAGNYFGNILIKPKRNL